MKDIKGFLNYYIGQDIDTGTGRVTLTGVHIDSFSRVAKAIVLNGNYTHSIDLSILTVKPILRQLSDMTDGEKKEYNERTQRKGYMAQVHADNTDWLIKKGFDIFFLIRDGLAIDAKTLKL
jgi:hypothetical protein